jgi:signal transduction histidine kinase
MRIVQANILQSDDGSGNMQRLFGVVQDITERRRAEQLIRHQSARSQLLADISRTLAEVGLDYQNVLQTVVKRTAELIGDLCVIILYDQDGKQNTPYAIYHRNPRALELIQQGNKQNWPGDPHSGRQLLSTEIICIPVVNPEEFRATLEPTFWPYFDEIGMSSLIHVPLQVQGEVMGTLSVFRDRYGPPYTQEDQAYLKDLADRAALTMQNAQLFEQVQASQGRLRVLSQRLVEVQETEQRRLAREIHDDISQALAVLVMQLGTARNLLSQSDKSAIEILEQSEELTEETLEHTRSIIAGLRPQILDDLGLLPALRHLGVELHNHAGVIVKVKSARLPKQLSPTIEITLFRIAQEALANIRKHAKARHAVISLVKEATQIVLSVQDDGTGFDMQSDRSHMNGDMAINGGLVVPAGHFGLIGIQEQVTALGGSFQMRSAPGEGTLIQVEIPL